MRTWDINTPENSHMEPEVIPPERKRRNTDPNPPIFGFQPFVFGGGVDLEKKHPCQVILCDQTSSPNVGLVTIPTIRKGHVFTHPPEKVTFTRRIAR